MPPVSLMLKPASSACNLACEYCFYHALADTRNIGCRKAMSEDTFEDIMTKAYAFANGQPVWLSFQGGEPLIAGKEFFAKAFEIAKNKNVCGSALSIGLQTNGTLLDDEWCELLRKNNVLVGLSIDGDSEGDRLRVYRGDKPSFEDAMRGAKLLKKHGVDFNILTVITKPVAERIEEIYAFFKQNGFGHLQYIPCLKPLEGDDKNDFYLSGEEYGDFLIKAFKLYARDMRAGKYVSVRLFDNFVRLANKQHAEQCGMHGHCTHQYVIESDGEVYPCDFYCNDEYSLGNISGTDFASLERSPKAIDFIMESLKKEDKCKACPFYALCAGGCKRERVSLDICTAYKKFLSFALPMLRRMS